MRIREVFLPILLSASSAYGEATLSLGVSGTSSHGLGYESWYSGALAVIDYSRGDFIARSELSWLDARKVETGDGSAISGKTLIGLAIRRFDFMLGAEHVIQKTSAWEKNATRAVLEVGYNWKNARFALTGRAVGGREESRSIGFRFDIGRRFREILTYDHVRFTSFFGEKGDGDKVTLAALWRF